MGCFLGCFGIPAKRKRRNPANRILPRNPKCLSYEPLDSSVSNKILETTKTPISSDSQLGDEIKEKERSSTKVRKKVSFNLNVQAYEPLPNDETTYYPSESDKEEQQERRNDTGSTVSLPINHRYQDCVDSYDDDDEDYLAYTDNDVDADDEDEDFDGYDFDDDQMMGQEELKQQLDSKSMEAECRRISGHNRTNGDLKPMETSTNARDRSQYISSVLNPVENLTQWKALKARAIPANKVPRKENTVVEQIPSVLFNCESNYNPSKPLLQEIAVDASLSNWLGPRDSKANHITNSIPFKRSMIERSCLQQSRESRPVLDITNLKA